MFGLGMPELVVVLVIAFLVFGANRLPELGSGLGKAIRGFKDAAVEVGDSPRAQPIARSLACPKCGNAAVGEGAYCAKCGTELARG
jgi:sec-independent protein translocase protein TatA